MTKTEYAAVRNLYITLLEKENRNEVEEAQYLYLDKMMTYISLRSQAIRMGNKNPDGNFLVKDAKERMEQAEQRLREIKEKATVKK